MKGHPHTIQAIKDIAAGPKPNYLTDRIAYNRWCACRRALGKPSRGPSLAAQLRKIAARVKAKHGA